MTIDALYVRIATRQSRLALIQADEAAHAVQRLLPGLRVKICPYSSPGDRDTERDLRQSDPDFFTRDLHEAVRTGAVDVAVHSAKDLEDPVPDDLDWFWLSDPADPRDALVMRAGESLDDLKPGAVAGVSSDRREAWLRSFRPDLRHRSLRGTIEERLAKVDEGEFDVLVMAAAALDRLGLAGRICFRIERDALRPPDGQGYLALTFRAGDDRWRRLRSLFVKPVVLAGAGCGSARTCTREVAEALARCEACFHDQLLDPTLLDVLPPSAERVDVGKRCGAHSATQDEIHRRITRAARRGLRVVRLKGGDPGFFGRLSEEVAGLDALQLPYRVSPGISSLLAATTGTGLLLTQRGVSRGFTVLTPRERGGGLAPIDARARASLPIVLFMGIRTLKQVVSELEADGQPAATPVAVVFSAGGSDELIVRGTLADIFDRVAEGSTDAPGLVIVGAPAANVPYRTWGALAGRSVLLPCSEALQHRAAAAVRDFGGVPLPLPLIRLAPEAACVDRLRHVADFDWLVVTSPASVRCLMTLLPDAGLDLRALPRILAAGAGTAAEFQAHGIAPDAVPERDYGGQGVLETARKVAAPGASMLRLRSRRAGPALAEALTGFGFEVTDEVLYDNERVEPVQVPPFDAVFFASASAADAYLDARPATSLTGKLAVAIGKPTHRQLTRRGVESVRTSPRATVEDAIRTLAAMAVEQALRTGERSQI